ncbi:MAG: DNA recombination protein RmuC [Candidatus Omnitrophica bacterium]|nr:DNA recombination protein RmuC [Candidatus Omnitrophota bacterium]MCK5288007.1 DNA recombination protein RmuC [Candidatus Omnitrophota bacterium]
MIVWLILLFILSLINLIAILILVFRPRINSLEFKNKFENFSGNQERIEKSVKAEISHNRGEINDSLGNLRKETLNILNTFQESVLTRIKETENSQKNQLDTLLKQLISLTQINDNKLEKIRETMQERIKSLQDENTKKLDEMRIIVDEKLHATLEKRLGESFKLVSERLESVYKGLGEMRTLTTSVDDLRKVFANVKTRGGWGEVQLGSLLEQMLTPDQYEKNVATKKGSNNRVEFAIKLPGQSKDKNKIVWLPIDAKFPQEDYQRLLEFQEQANPEMTEKAAKQLEIRIKSEAKDIKDKYLNPPDTTDFGILFLPAEGLYAEILRRPGLCEILQRDYRIIVSGPTTFAALLNSLQMGFRTLAIEKRSSEVWNLLGAVKTEFIKFGAILDKTKLKLTQAVNAIDDASSKSRNIQKKLKKVQELPVEKETVLIKEVPSIKDSH